MLSRHRVEASPPAHPPSTAPRGSEELPSLAVIVPVYNAEATVEKLIESLLAQDYPGARMRIVFVDNGSTDRTREIIGRHPVTLLEETAIRSSYAARNRGIRACDEDVFAFIDGDCIARRDWISRGVAALADGAVALVAGKTEFYFSDPASTAELYDASVFLQTDTSSDEFQTSPTCNLFVRAEVFAAVGEFPAHVISLGDYQWTKRATASGNRLIRAPEAVVLHPARTLAPLLKKCFRTGTGQPYVWLSEGERLTKVFGLVAGVLDPRRMHARSGRAGEGGAPADGRSPAERLRARPLRRLGVALLCKGFALLGMLYSIAAIKLDQRRAHLSRHT